MEPIQTTLFGNLRLGVSALSEPYIRLRRDLTTAVPAPVWPDGVRLVPFAVQDVPAIHALMVLAYSQGGGSVASLKPWWLALSADDEFDPGLCLVAKSADDTILAFAQSWTSGFLKDLVVHPSARRQGLGEAMLYATFTRFAARGLTAVDLKVETANSSARRLYERVGMVPAES